MEVQTMKAHAELVRLGDVVVFESQPVVVVERRKQHSFTFLTVRFHDGRQKTKKFWNGDPVPLLFREGGQAATTQNVDDDGRTV